MSSFLPYWFKLTLLAVPSLAALPVAALSMTLSPTTTFSFSDGLGVNAHVYTASSPEKHFDAVISALKYLGVQHVRVDQPYNEDPDRITELGANGFRTDLIERGVLPPNISFLIRILPYLDSIEGPNEVNVTPFHFNGVFGIPAAVEYQKSLFTLIRSDSRFKNVPVVAFTRPDSPPNKPSPYGNISSFVDLGNVHAYHTPVEPPGKFLNDKIAQQANDAPGRKVIVSEFGNHTLTTIPNGSGVTDNIQAIWTLDAWADDILLNGVKRHYIYELVDAGPDPNENLSGEFHYGLFADDWIPKVAATAIHNTNTIIGSPTSDFPLKNKSLNVTLNGMPENANCRLLEAADGRFFLIIWAEQQLWNPKTRQELDIPTTPVELTFPTPASQILTYDPITSLQPVQSLREANTLTVDLSSHPLIVEVTVQ